MPVLEKPIGDMSLEIKRLEDATQELLDILKEVSEKQGLSDEQILELRNTINRVAAKKMAGYYLENRFSGFVSYLSDACCMALKTRNGLQEREYTELMYLNHTKKLLSNGSY